MDNTPLLNPPFRRPGWDVKVVQRGLVFAGRFAFSVRAEIRNGSPGYESRERFDRYVAVIDAEYGLPLRIAGMVDEQEAWAEQVRSVEFNVPIADEVFTIDAPPDTPVVRVTTA
jgi:hypothetical protein